MLLLYCSDLEFIARYIGSILSLTIYENKLRYFMSAKNKHIKMYINYSFEGTTIEMYLLNLKAKR